MGSTPLNIPPIGRICLLIASGLAIIVGLELFAAAWWHVALVGFVFVAITAMVAQFRRVALDRVRASEARLQLQLRRMPTACITLDRGCNITSWNAAAERIFGWTAREIIGRPASILVPGGLTPELNGLIDSILSGDVVDRQVNANVKKDGRTIICRWASAPLIENGEITGILSMAEDVTEERRTEEALQESLTRYRDLLDALPHHIFSVDKDNRYLALNASACRFFGLSEGEIIGRTPEEAGIPLEIARDWHEVNARTRETGCVQTLDLVFPGPEPRHEHVITGPLRNHCGEVVGVTGIAIDVTSRKRAEQAQRRLDEQMAHYAKMEALGTLAGGVAHDFNNILSIILAHALILERRRPDERGSVGSIKRAVERGAAISRHILTLARRTGIHTGSVDVAVLVEELQALVAETFPRTVRIEVASDPDLPLVSGDAGQLHEALLNLCINSRDAMPDGGVLGIDVRLAGAEEIAGLYPDAPRRDHVVVSISDDGIGMDEETRRRIFEPFFTTKEKGKGTGLGLAMVYGIVHAHGAQLDFESELGCGTSFRLYFPVAASAAPALDAGRMPEQARGERLLVIEDEPEILAGLEMQLTEAGYVVRTACNGVDAIENFGEVPDLVLMDLGMPRMGAAELIDAIRVVAPEMPIVAMTGYVDPEVHAAVRDAGVTRILQKPFVERELLGAVSEALQLHAA
ncbi:MAG TPA: PAS domain S-box protein [Thermoanaerobaculia bacterium]